MNKNNQKVSLIIPAYQEERSIESVLLELNEMKIKASNIDEIIVVDDGSTDKTAEIVSSYSEFKLIIHIDRYCQYCFL